MTQYHRGGQRSRQEIYGITPEEKTYAQPRLASLVLNMFRNHIVQGVPPIPDYVLQRPDAPTLLDDTLSQEGIRFGDAVQASRYMELRKRLGEIAGTELQLPDTDTEA